MNSGPDIWVVVLAALSGGLIGSILQPGFEYILDKLRARDRERNRKERRLRKMVEAFLQVGVSLEIGVDQIVWRAQRNLSTSRDECLELLDSEREGTAFWPGRRIDDEMLRNTGAQFYNVVWELAVIARDSAYPLSLIELAKMAELADRLASLRHEIIDRMDELNWPEID